MAHWVHQKETTKSTDLGVGLVPPAQAKFAELVLAGEPFVIRKGADHLGLKRYLWTRKNFLAQYGKSRAIVNKIPCVHSGSNQRAN